jgi:hypothetical protein
MKGHKNSEDHEGFSAEDRDDRVLAYAQRKATGRESLTPAPLSGYGCDARGGALRRLTENAPMQAREDYASIRALKMPLGYAAYVDPTANPYDYVYYNVAGWRVAVPRETHPSDLQAMLLSISTLGPSGAGFIRLGDTLVPSYLGTGDRMLLSQTSVDISDPYELSP